MMSTDSRSGELSLALVSFIAETDYESLPSKIVQAAKLLIAESVAASLLGSSLELGRTIATRIWSEPVRYAVPRKDAVRDVEDAAFLNAAFADCCDATGGSARTPLHPGKNLIPAAIAAWMRSGLPGRELVTAVALASEVGFRIDDAVGASHKARGHYVDGTIGALASAAAVGRLLCERERDIGSAVAIASLLAPVTVGGAGMFRSSARPLALGQAAAIGVRAVDMARAGIVGPEQALERPGGFAEALAGQSIPVATFASLGEDWILSDYYLKPFVGCRLTHVARQGVAEMMTDSRVVPENIRRIVVRHPKQDLPVIGHHASLGGNEVEHSCSESYLIASVLMYGELGSELLSNARRHDAALHRFASSIEVLEGPHLTTERHSFHGSEWVPGRPVEVEIYLVNEASPRVFSGRFALGDAAEGNAMKESDISEKVVNACKGFLSQSRSNELAGLLLKVEALPSPNAVRSILADAA